MIEIELRDGLYHVRGPKFELCLTKAEFIQALRRAKWVKRRQAQQARQPHTAPGGGDRGGVAMRGHVGPERPVSAGKIVLGEMVMPGEGR
jgi:hypothetical protein